MSELTDLLSLITNATKRVEGIFQRSAQPSVPSLNETAPHPFDTQITPIELKQAIQTIEGACAQLCATVSRPSHTVLNKLMQIYEPACLNVAVTFRIPDILQEKPSGMHVSEIAEKTGVEPGKLSRVLRLLATKHCFIEVAADVFANNRLSITLLSTNPLSSLALHFGDENNKSTSLLAETLADPEFSHSYRPDHTPFNKWSNSPLPLFTYYESDAPGANQRGTRFALAMQGWSAATEAAAVVRYFPWGDLRDGATVCDVGGGIGHITMQLAKAFPGLRLKLQDSPDRMLQASAEIWPVECPEALQDGRVEFIPLNFLNETPVKECDVYYLKHIIHDWPDKEAVIVLKNVQAAMAPTSRVLIHEYILDPAHRPSSDDDDDGHHSHSPTQAPEPLLPNYGAGRIRQYSLDVDMMAMTNSRERRLDEFVQLGCEAGLRFVKLWDLGETGALEFRLV